MPRRVRGVALILTNPVGDILILRELRSKPHLGKLEGMLSVPMETSLSSEAAVSTLWRLHEEELPGLSLTLPGTYIGAYRIVPGAWVRLYTTIALSNRLPVVSGESPEVGDYRWVSVAEAADLWLRQGALEMIEDYVQGHRNVRREWCSPPRKKAA